MPMSMPTQWPHMVYQSLSGEHVSHVCYKIMPLEQKNYVCEPPTLPLSYPTKGRFTLRWRRPPVGQECLAKTWLYEANGGCAGEELKAIKYFY